MKKNILNLFLLIALFIGVTSCKRKGEIPPVKPQGTSLTIADLKAIASCTNNCNKVFTTDTYLSAVVLADDVTGNFYKETFVRDATGAIHLTFKAAPIIFIGDSIRINMKGLSIGYNPTTYMLEVDSIDTDKSMIKLGAGTYPQPKVLDMNLINTPNYFAGFINDLVEIKGIGFSPADANQLYVNINTTAQSRLMNSCGGDPITLRTNAYAKFAGQKTPSGFGNIIGIATNFGTTKQLVIRNTTEWSMTYTSCVTPGLYIKKNFNDALITSGGWTTQNVTGNINWVTSTLGSWANKPYAQISNFVSGNQVCESWLISPPINLSASTNPILTFQNACNYTGPVLEVLVSTNYTSGSPNTATWTPLTYTLSAGGFAFVNSGNISMSAYKTSGVTIAYKYTGTASSGRTWELDDIIVSEN
ncbi:MAG: choice-of-anchor J domain-containing protein [Bacteroidetes bacterium]|nr:choice-of-anchor J domain-containing protein [Bacteroidota bacterium]